MGIRVVKHYARPKREAKIKFIETDAIISARETKNKAVSKKSLSAPTTAIIYFLQSDGVPTLLEARGLQWQFTVYKPMGQVRQLDKRMNDAGLLRLMVSDPLAMNLSNTLGFFRGQLKQAGKKKTTSFGKRVLELGPIKKILLLVYNKIFNWYYS